MGSVIPEQPSGSGKLAFEVMAYINCLKSAEEVEVTFRAKTMTTTVNFITGSGDKEDCQFVLNGNPYSLNSGQTKTYPVTSKPLVLPEAAAAMLTGFTFGELDSNGVFHPTYTAKNLKSFSADDFIDILTTLPIDQSYQRFVGLLDGPTTLTGTRFSDHFETGTGTDTVNGLGGNDFVNKWQAGNLTYKAGAGFDTLDFEAANGAYFPVMKTQTLVLDLKTGVGQNPFGGTLKVDSVEKVIGTDAADKIYGSDKAEWIETQDYGADIVKARGGNDTVVLWPFANGAKLDGGAGKDTLQTAFEFGENTLDMTNSANNTGKFENGSIKNFEVFNFSSFSTDPLTSLTLRAGAGSETVTMSGSRSLILYMGDGNNKVQAGSGKDFIETGKGKDRIEGGMGDDTMSGGANIDTFIFKTGHGEDIVKDFDAVGKDHDIIDLSGVASVKNWNDLHANHLTTIDGNAAIETSNHDTIILTGVRLKNLDADDFIFA